MSAQPHHSSPRYFHRVLGNVQYSQKKIAIGFPVAMFDEIADEARRRQVSFSSVVIERLSRSAS